MFESVHSNANLRRERPMTLHDHPALPAGLALTVTLVQAITFPAAK